MDPDWFGEKKYTGTFDGNGHVIRGLYIERESEEYVGLFGALGENGSLGEYGTVENVGLEDFYIKGDRIVGGVVARNYGTVSNVYSMGTVSGNEHVGGVVGSNNSAGRYHGVVSNVYNTGSVSGSNAYVGGVVGKIWKGSSVENAYYNSDFISYKAVGAEKLSESFDIEGKAYGMTTAELANGTLPNGFDEGVWGAGS